jgi:hypothetical protein
VRLILCDAAGRAGALAQGRRGLRRPDPDAFLEVLDHLRAELADRLDSLLAQSRRKVAPGDGLPLLVVAIDELAFYLNTGVRKLDEQTSAALRDLIARGPQAGRQVPDGLDRDLLVVPPSQPDHRGPLPWLRARRAAAPHQLHVRPVPTLT